MSATDNPAEPVNLAEDVPAPEAVDRPEAHVDLLDERLPSPPVDPVDDSPRGAEATDASGSPATATEGPGVGVFAPGSSPGPADPSFSVEVVELPTAGTAVLKVPVTLSATAKASLAAAVNADMGDYAGAHAYDHADDVDDETRAALDAARAAADPSRSDARF